MVFLEEFISGEEQSNYKKLEDEYNELKLKILSLRTNLEFKEKDFTAVYNKKEDLKDELKRLRSIDGERELPRLQAELKRVEEELSDRFSSEAIRKLQGIARKKEELSSRR